MSTKIDYILLKEYKDDLPSNFKPNLHQLEELADVIDTDSPYFESLLLETAIVSLFTTNCGLSVLNLLTGFKTLQDWTGLNIKMINDEVLNSWHTDKLLLLRFLSFILKNSDFPLNYDSYDDPSIKDSLSFLLLKEPSVIPLLANTKYNLLLDYLTNACPLIISILQPYLDPVFFNNIIDIYNRSYELVNDNKCVWYDLIDELDVSGNASISIKITQSCISIINAFLTAFDADSTFFLDKNSLTKGLNSNTDNNLDTSIADDNIMLSIGFQDDGTVVFPDLMSHISNRHDILAKILRVADNDTFYNSPLLHIQFKLICALTDPLTQPSPNDKNVISIDLLYNLFLGLMKPEIDKLCSTGDGIDWKFLICFNMEKIIYSSMKNLNCFDSKILNEVNINDDEGGWRNTLSKWLPHGFNTQDLELLYMINILCVYTIYKLNEDMPIQFNPFISSLVEVWKNLSSVILLGLEIDRLEEENETFETPLLVRATVRSSSALRSVIATILNDHVTAFKHDFEHESLNAFMSPFGRKLANGSLYADFRSHVASILALTGDLEYVAELVSDLQPGDRFDEDIKYMFEYEFDDYNTLPNMTIMEEPELIRRSDEVSEVQNDDNNAINEINNRKEEEIQDELEVEPCLRRCNCLFDDDELKDDHIDDFEIDQNIINRLKKNYAKRMKEKKLIFDHIESVRQKDSSKKHAIRSEKALGIDRTGKDWRDIPRGENFNFNPEYEFIEVPTLQLVFGLMLGATNRKLDRNECTLLLRNVASAVKNEQDRLLSSGEDIYEPDEKSSEIRKDTKLINKGSSEDGNKEDTVAKRQDSDDLTEVTPDDIYEIWCEEGAFERMIHLNYEVTFRLMDEMLMCPGYRRVLIWFITHLELNHSIIHYIFELLMGIRGMQSNNNNDSPKEKPVNMIMDDFSKIFELNLPFSRQGYIKLSDIEHSMLLQEFLTNAAIQFAEVSKDYATSNENSDDENEGEFGGISLYAIGLMRLICFMIQGLLENGRLKFEEEDSVFELQTLLINWISIIPEAKALFFRIKSSIANREEEKRKEEAERQDEKKDNTDEIQNDDTQDQEASQESSGRKEMKQLMDNLLKLLPLQSAGEDDTVAIDTLKNCIMNFSFEKQAPILGRKVVYSNDKILPLPTMHIKKEDECVNIKW